MIIITVLRVRGTSVAPNSTLYIDFKSILHDCKIHNIANTVLSKRLQLSKNWLNSMIHVRGSIAMFPNHYGVITRGKPSKNYFCFVRGIYNHILNL